MKKIIIPVCISLLVSGCVKEITPSDAITTGTLIQTKEGLTNAVNGAYALFKDHVPFNGLSDPNLMYLRQYFQL
jgi:starch-binding outer membrane protein, SusD/RagB family